MTVFAIGMMRDEEDVAEHVILHLLDEGIDCVIVADNGSRDRTREILESTKEHGNVIVLDDPELGYYQSRKMTNLAHMAAEHGAVWILPFDADEIWYSHADRIKVVLDRQHPAVRVARAPLFNHFPSNIDPTDGCAFQNIVYRQPEAGALPKVAFRYHSSSVIGQGNHSVYMDGVRPVQFADRLLELRHFPYRTEEQFIRKARNGAEAYAATDLDHNQGAHWREYGAILEHGGEEALLEVFYQWFHFPAPVTAGLVYDPAPFRRWG